MWYVDRMVRKKAHSVFHIRYHIVIIPKYRKPILKASVRAYMYTLIRRFCKEYELNVVELALMPDHVHLCVDATPKYSPAQLVQRLKSITAREIFKKYPQLREQYWAGEFWSDGYYIGTAGDKQTSEMIREYIRHQ